jgi:hypothetical protein
MPRIGSSRCASAVLWWVGAALLGLAVVASAAAAMLYRSGRS